MHLGRWQSFAKSSLFTLGPRNEDCLLLGVEGAAVGSAQVCHRACVCGRFFFKIEQMEKIVTECGIVNFYLFIKLLKCCSSNNTFKHQYQHFFSRYFNQIIIFIYSQQVSVNSPFAIILSAQSVRTNRVFQLVERNMTLCRFAALNTLSEKSFPFYTTKFKRVQLYRLRQIFFFHSSIKHHYIFITRRQMTKRERER